VAAGVLAYGVHDLQEARVLPGLDRLAFDISSVLDPSTFLATVLKGIFNFSPAATVLEAVAWVAYVAVVLPLFVRRLRTPGITPPPSRAADEAAATTTPGASA
jgi:high-affinity iron transporter